MAAFLADSVLDNGLQYLTTNGDRCYICDTVPTTFTEATSTYAIGNKTGITIGSPTNGTTSGRKVVMSAITGGSITATDTATHFAIVDFGSSELLVVEELAAPVAVTSGNTFSLTAVEVEIPDAV
jgi:hypothetical protein